MTVLFIGTGEIGLPTLQWLLGPSGHRVTGLVCQPDKPAGRQQVLTPPATKTLALALDAGLPVFQPEKINDPAALDAILASRPDLIVVMAYGQFLPARIRQGGRLGCINLHASLLPRWRGASPIQSALAAGDAETGITVMHVVREMDAGDIILAEPTPILPDDTGESLHDRLATLAPVALARALPLLETNTAPRLPQHPDQVTRCAKLTRALGRLNWSQPAAELERLIRAYHPWPGTHTTLPPAFGNRTVKIFPPTRIAPPPAPGAIDPTPGQITAAHHHTLTVATGTENLALTTLQTEGQKRLPTREFLAGTRLEPGQLFGQT